MLENSGGMKGNRIFAPEIKLLASMKRVFPDLTLSMRHLNFDSLLDVLKSGLTARCFFLSEIPKRVWYYLSGTMTYGYLFMSHSRIFTSKGVRVMDESMRRILYLSLTEAGAVSQRDSAICT